MTLTDTQLVLLSAASRREDGAIVLTKLVAEIEKRIRTIGRSKSHIAWERTKEGFGPQAERSAFS